MYQFRMPSLGADMEAGTLVEWEKHPGDSVKRGDVVAVVETQKGAIEVEIFVDGRMGKQLVPLGTKVPVGTPLAEIEGAVEAMPAAPQPVMPPVGARRPPCRHPAAPGAGSACSCLARGAQTRRRTWHRHRHGQRHGSRRQHRSARRRTGVWPRLGAPPRRGLDLAKMRKAIAAAMEALQARNSALLSCPRH